MRKLDHTRALVLFSGGQDSAISLAWALDRYAHVETIGFDYGQRHAVELNARRDVREAIRTTFPQWAAKLGDDTLVDASGLKALGETAMTHAAEIKMGEDGLPTTFVPGRNLVFLTLAGGLAYRRDIGELVAGMCEADFSGYPDCRSDALTAQADALRLGMNADFALQTPLMHIDKAESWRLAERLGGETLVTLINEKSHTCYRGERGTRHDWGYGCGACPACELRAKGWSAYAALSAGGTNVS
ncbi:MAG: 7-cyano-7-deazaguanine synthase QueC [Pseudomonadota bacterium]